MTLSTKPGVHNISHCRQGSTEPRPQLTCTENLLTFAHVVFEICKRTDKQTDKQRDRHTYTQITILRIPTGERSNHSAVKFRL